MSYSSYKAKQSKEKQMLLKAQLTELEDKISETLTPDIIDSYYDDAKSALGSIIHGQSQRLNDKVPSPIYQ